MKPWWGSAQQSAIPQADKPFDLSFQGRSLEVTPAGTLQTGAAEDSRVYLVLADFDAWTKCSRSTIEIAASGTPEEVDAAVESAGPRHFRRPRFGRCARSRRRSARVEQDPRRLCLPPRC